VAELKEALDKLEAIQAREEEAELKEMIQARLELAAAERRFQALQAKLTMENESDRGSLLTTIEAKIREWDQYREGILRHSTKGKNDPLLQKADEEIEHLRKELPDHQAKYEANVKQREDRLAAAQKELITAEVKYKLLERQLAARSQRRQAQIDTTAARLAQLRDVPVPPAGDVRRIGEIERKIDELLREVKELRRELRK
jgi:hypothetical protein